VLTLLFAGHDTSSCALASFCLLLAQHPAVLSRLRAEQDELAPSGPLSTAALDRMPYLDQVIREVLRFIPPVGGGFRKIIAPCEFDGYRLPVGWNAFYQIRGPHRDAAIFGRPDLFDPDRFAPERAEDRSQRFSFIPFGGGPRVCLGMEFARLEMAVMGALLVREFDWQLVPGQDLRLAPIPLPRPRSGLLARLSQRR
jgi:retinoid hydroxylase